MSATAALPIRWTTVFLDLPAADHPATAAFWCEVTGSRLSAARGPDGEFATLLPPSGDAWLRVQRLGTGPARTHLDLHVDPATSLDDAADAVRSLGAGTVPLDQPDDEVRVLRSPGGYVFCLVPWEGEERPPAPVTLDTGGASRADQLCLDIPPADYGTEVAFWAAVTGWPLRQGSLPEFRALDRPEALPVRLLLQKRLTAAEGDRVSGHVDLACDDRDALTDRHLRAGAALVQRHSFWTTLRDPAGSLYCLTPRDPRTGRLPAAR